MNSRKFIINFLLLAFPTLAFSQKSKLTLTPFLGLTLSTISDKEVEVIIPNRVAYSGLPVKPKPGFQCGFIVDALLTEHFALSSGFSFIQKGYAFRSGGGGGFGNLGSSSGADITRYTANYLELPVTAKLYLNIEKASFFIDAGASAAYLIDYYNSSSNQFSLLDKVHLNQDHFQRKDIGLVAGGGVQIKSGSSEVHFEVRYTYGLINQFKQEFSKDPIRNRVISFMVGKTIHLIRKPA